MKHLHKKTMKCGVGGFFARFFKGVQTAHLPGLEPAVANGEELSAPMYRQ